MSQLIDIWGLLETIVDDKNNYAITVGSELAGIQNTVSDGSLTFNQRRARGPRR